MTTGKTNIMHLNTDFKMKTAVEFFEEELKDKLGTIVINKNWELLEEIIEQAKAMEKEQIKDAHIDGVLTFTDNRTAEQYYNETFKSE